VKKKPGYHSIRGEKKRPERLNPIESEEGIGIEESISAMSPVSQRSTNN